MLVTLQYMQIAHNKSVNSSYGRPLLRPNGTVIPDSGRDSVSFNAYKYGYPSDVARIIDETYSAYDAFFKQHLGSTIRIASNGVNILLEEVVKKGIKHYKITETSETASAIKTTLISLYPPIQVNQSKVSIKNTYKPSGKPQNSNMNLTEDLLLRIRGYISLAKIYRNI